MEPLLEQLDWRDRIKKIGLETGPSVKGEIVIEAPADNVWEVISEAGNLKKCHPFCDQIEIIKWPGADAVDTITYYSGITYRRNFVGWEEGAGRTSPPVCSGGLCPRARIVAVFLDRSISLFEGITDGSKETHL